AARALRAIAETLNPAGVPTAGGGRQSVCVNDRLGPHPANLHATLTGRSESSERVLSISTAVRGRSGEALSKAFRYLRQVGQARGRPRDKGGQRGGIHEGIRRTDPAGRSLRYEGASTTDVRTP